MINIQRVLLQDRLTKAFTGSTVDEFEKLVALFSEEINKFRWKKYEKEKKQRKREPGGGAIGSLKTVETKLFFILTYFKCYPTMDVMGILFDLDRSNVKRNLDFLTSILEKTLGKKKVLPKRKIRSLQEFMEFIPKETKDLFIDGTERPIQRPKKKQGKYYSGKKKRHTRTNLVMSDDKRNINYLGKTRPGHEMDYGIFKDEFHPDYIPKWITFWLDKGFQGVKKDYPKADIMIPSRKPRKKDFSDSAKEENKIISGIRILSEHAISGIKRFKVLADRFRNHSEKFSDKAIFLSCGLWNYHLQNC